MQHDPDLRILFATSFSDACFRTSAAIAQLADNNRIHLTIVHVAKPGTATAATRRDLDCFMAEADHYDSCHRLLVESFHPAEAIARICAHEGSDLVVSPASDRLGFNRLFKPSFRARLLGNCSVPLWTAGKCLDSTSFRNPIRTISCLVDFETGHDTHIRLAASLARRVGASFRIAHVIEPVHEGMLARSIDSSQPLMPDMVVEQVRTLFAGRPIPDVDVMIGEPETALPALLSRSNADLMFVGPGQALRGGRRARLASSIDRLPCPVVCVDGAATGFDNWSFQRHEPLTALPESFQDERSEAVMEYALVSRRR